MPPHLSEFQRRLWLGAEKAAELGPGGVALVAEATGVAAVTGAGVARKPTRGTALVPVGPVGRGGPQARRGA